MNKLLEDISTLTSLPKNLSKDLIPIMECSVTHKVLESILSGEEITHIDLGIGSLYIKNEGTVVKYRFVPSKKLEEEVAKVYVTKESPLEKRLEKSLLNKIENAYKGLV